MKRFLLLFAAILMASTGMWAADNVAYIDATGALQYKDGVTEITNSTTTLSGWCVVNSTVTTGSLTCSGEVHLILADGAKLTATGATYCAGIQVSGEDNSLTVYGQTAQTGQLIANGGDKAAGIGGGEFGSGSNITINGGMVTANGGDYAAGIGGGEDGSGSNITINRGTVTATGGEYGAGIGGGVDCSGSNITINGGTVTANGGYDASGIGGSGSSNIFVATRCIVKAGPAENPTEVIENTGSDLATSLEGKLNVIVEPMKFAVTYGDNITVSPVFASGAEIEAGTQITFTAADRWAEDYCFIGFYKESTFDTPITTGVNGSTYTVTVTDAISVYAKYEPLFPYVYPVYNAPNDVIKGIEKWETGKVSAIEVTSSTEPVTWGEAGKTTWYVVTSEDVTLSQGAICYGDVRLILADGAKLTANGVEKYAGITTVADAGNSLTIYGQTAQSGQLVAHGGKTGAGIGSGSDYSGEEITINGGTITATGGAGAAGIGGGYQKSGYDITINGGTVTANGGSGSAGIGGGINGNGDRITINGGTVTAYGFNTGAGIGGGDGGNGDRITINGGVVTSIGRSCAAGIGGGRNGIGTFITINGGTVTAIGGSESAGIGSGDYGAYAALIFVATNLIVKAGASEKFATVIENDGDDLVFSLAGKQYATITEPYFNITANQDPDDETHYYSTFYSRTCDYQVPSGVTAYTGAVDGDVLRLTAISGGIIPTGEAVILRLTTEDNTATKKQFTLTATTTSATKSKDNKLSGTDVAKTLGENDYALSLGQKGVGFYLWEGKEIAAHKAYLTLESPTMAKTFTFMFDDGETTAIEQPAINGKQSGDTYNLNGVHVNDNYKGIVIKNGKKVYQK